MTKQILKLAVANLCLFIVGSCAFVPIEKNVLLFTYFLGDGDGLRMAYSRDGYKWTPLRNGDLFLKPEVGSKQMRDPSLVEGRDRRFHLVWTSGSNDKGFGYSSSKDLINWSEQRFIPVNEKLNATYTRAPEIFYDRKPKLFYIIWSATIPGLFPETDKDGEQNNRLYYVTTQNFVDFSQPKIFFNPGFNCIDGSLIEANGKYQLIFIDDRTDFKTIRISTAEKLDGQWTVPTEPITTLNGIQGPSGVKVGNDWLIYFDHHLSNQTSGQNSGQPSGETSGQPSSQTSGALRSRDFRQWEDVTNQISFPKDMKQGSVLRVTDETLEVLLQDSARQKK
jgi:Arabinosidase BT_3657-like, N-terminal